MTLDVCGVLGRLSVRRPIFHSEADFQHALAWQLQTEHADAQIRLESRPERGIRLDLLVTTEGERVAVELKYLVGRFDGIVEGERFVLPNQAAHDISRHDFIKDVTRIERFVADGFADSGWAIALSNDGAYWRPGTKLDPIDAMFRLNENRLLEGRLSWSAQAGAGTTRKREEPLLLRGRYACNWRQYSTVRDVSERAITFRYLAFEVSV
jgi:hypothetical protein